MDRVAVFVDAGYLFAQGSAAIWGQKQPRSILDINPAAVITEFTATASAKAPNVPLLRVYWYDGVYGYKGPTLEHTRLAHMDSIKIRLGFVNSQGQQKGVDSLIVTDLVDLARNRAITDAVLLSGDEDVRIGVVLAQSFGVRVHLVGIVPSRGSQSIQLMQEADTTTEWDKATVARFLSIQAHAVAAGPKPAQPVTLPPSPPAGLAVAAKTALNQVVDDFLAALTSTDSSDLKNYWKTARGLPREFDGKLIARGRTAIGRDLDTAERKYIRIRFTDGVNARP